jgi:putative ABC transport system permease protein
MRDDLVRGVRPALLILFATVAFVLLIACANVGALLLARGESRRREFAIRAALGASRGRIVRQLLTEGAVLALAGAAGGLLIAAAVPAVTALPALSHVPRLADAGVDWRVLAFALCVSIVAALIFTLVPAAAFSGRSGIPAQEALRAGSRVGRTVRAGRLLAAGEIALATLVLVVALVLTSAFARLLDRDPGIRSDGLMTLRVALPPTYSRSGEITRFFDAAVDRIKALPGVESAGAITQLPFSGAMLGSSFRVDPADGGGVRQADADLRGVTPDYFATLGIGLVEGRLLSARDAAQAPMVAVIDETLARRVSPGSSAIGRRIRWIRQPEVPIEIVGVVRSVRHRGVEQPARETVYRPHAQYARSTMYLAVRTSSDPAALAGPVAAAVQSVDPDQPVSDVMTMSARMRRALAQPGFGAGLGAGLAALALALAGVGVYAVFAFAVAQRRKEMGVRMALGASPSAVLGLVLRDGATVAGAGLLVGLPASTLAIAWVRSMLTGADSGAAPPIAAAGFTMAALALLACWVPARRACRVDPSRALRTD